MPMAADLATAPASGLRVQLCGDAHLSNFGAFASPERRLVFDVNDFDDTLPGSFEWDVKRLAASLAVAGRENGFGRQACRKIVLAAAGSYRTAMQRPSVTAPPRAPDQMISRVLRVEWRPLMMPGSPVPHHRFSPA